MKIESKRKGFTIIGVLGIILVIGLVVGVSIFIYSNNRENKGVVENREETPINRREQDRLNRDIGNNIETDSGLLPDIDLPKVESKIVDNIAPIRRSINLQRFKPLALGNNSKKTLQK